MATEVEHKFLVISEAWRAAVERSVRMSQGYLVSDEVRSVRVRLEGDEARLNIKSSGIGTSRAEYEYPIPLADAEELLATLCGTKVEKTRYYVPFADHLWEIDVFEGDNAGLVVAEVELAYEGEPFARPDWAGEEVSLDVRYYNTQLALHPYRSW
ncbi:CYTH domain-containing protein [Plasticicumulans acidivorans]|uniref:Adenylate cyclase n=1 Tax=Plasticicumulans acidivorans TaxID=886464 RepID=A0A317MTU1_9GAMM|nr:CYTH domain-containing protein [Plasticicumulans acidivorans]PWV60526.1 adenylate cyclase [Plasticicumulans acidivorans]